MSITQLPADVAVAYKHVHDRLTAVSRKAYAGKMSSYEATNRAYYEEARAHLNTIENAEGDALGQALLAAGAWLASVS